VSQPGRLELEEAGGDRHAGVDGVTPGVVADQDHSAPRRHVLDAVTADRKVMPVQPTHDAHAGRDRIA
jgi:hypothetical protein